MSAKVLAVNMTALGGHVVCLGDRSNITFEHALFQGNVGRSLAVIGEGPYLHVKGSSFVNNSDQGPKATGAALFISNGTALLVSSSFDGNSVGFRGGAIAVEGAAHVRLISSMLNRHQGRYIVTEHGHMLQHVGMWSQRSLDLHNCQQPFNDKTPLPVCFLSGI
jgi:predicted outer membrane repeat protein